MDKVYKAEIIRVISNSKYVPVNKAELAGYIKAEDEAEFDSAVNQLVEEGRLVVTGKGLVKLPTMPSKVTGRYRSNRRRFGFVIPDIKYRGGDVYIPEEFVNGAVDGDTVVARVKKSRGHGPDSYDGRVIEVKKRARERFVGVLKKKKSFWAVMLDGNPLGDYVIVDDVGAKGAKEGDKVLVSVMEFPTETAPARGVILEVLGKPGLYDTELAAVIGQYELPGDFPEQCINEAEDISQRYFKQGEADPADGAEDISNKIIITIDPHDARDFDDAISLEQDDKGRKVLGVHIADVSRFVTPDSQLDVEAKERGNSVYLPGKVIPMLPEVLSNGICSLQPKQPRFVKSAYITYDGDGNVVDARFANSVINSFYRLTYKEANEILQGRSDFPKEVLELMKEMNSLARIIEKRRRRQGMLHLDLPETELIMDDNGKVVDAEPADDSYPHTIIEMFMVEANEAVARLMHQLNVPAIRRIHPAPDVFGMRDISSFTRVFGIKVPKKLDRFALQALLSKVKGTNSEYAINNFVLRNFTRAEYSPLKVGHYALASEHYTHFTSPIRRYADLTIHRLLQEYLEGRLKKGGKNTDIPNEDDLIALGEHLGETENNAESAERDLIKTLILTMLSERIGSVLKCVVSGVTRSGIFARCMKYGIEGFIKVELLGNEQWHYEQSIQSLIGKFTGKHISLGTALKAKVVSVNVPGKQLDLAPVEPLVNRKSMTKSVRKAKGKGGSGKKRRRR
ncbi:Ribonuclease R [Limihaloglobus sulfuriphilus]|uniref:Ribonuclease R n=1 Tax=Limihaloglobus sulfuriphilus TaxID=1851148 RepID=A0A1Q2MB48_9BACT|nr:ribonuclease R [Limihaloglobus sulfuriphilus]AQQ69889.1 Ribonuclease R [Limihaloglobus sulfuriphilus]